MARMSHARAAVSAASPDTRVQAIEEITRVETLIDEAITTIQELAEQQAMEDGWWRPTVERLRML